MTTNRILSFILGVLTIIGGLWCAATPGLTYLSMVWVIGFVMFFHAVEGIVTYGTRKALGIADGWSLAGAIISCICGLLIIFSSKAEFVTGVAILYYLFFWLIISGVFGIVGAFKLKKHTNTGVAAVDNFTGKWGWFVVLGILMIIAGFFGFAHPLLSMISIGLIVAIDIVAAGINMIAIAFSI